MKAMTITYPVKQGIYVNMTNRCPCACTFCLRQNAPGVYGSDPLWLEREPTVEETVASLEQWNLEQYEEIVFCGYGEPTERLDDLLEVCRRIKAKHGIPIRINTNGLSDLIHGRDTAPELEGLVDALSISLNASNAEDYLKLTRSRFGIKSFDAMCQFTKNAAHYVPKVMMSIVDTVTTPEEQAKAAEICASLGVTLRIRPYES